jgi:hypothetical protein
MTEEKIEDDEFMIEKTGPNTLRIIQKDPLEIWEMTYETYLKLIGKE